MNLAQIDPAEFTADAEWLKGEPLGVVVEKMRVSGNYTPRWSKHRQAMCYRALHFRDLEGRWYPVTFGCESFVEIALPDGTYKRMYRTELANYIDRSFWPSQHETAEERQSAADHYKQMFQNLMKGIAK